MFVKVINNIPVRYPYTLGDLYKENPQVSFPEEVPESILELYGIYKVIQTQPPEVDSKTHKIQQSVELVNGIWTQKWNKVEIELEQASRNIRAYRNKLLTSSDWMALSDNNISDEWRVYRQLLRDISLQEEFPYSVSWPVPPSNY